jgi:hypothetical protein
MAAGLLDEGVDDGTASAGVIEWQAVVVHQVGGGSAAVRK